MCWEPGPLSGNSKNKIHVTSDCEDEGITCVVVSYDNQLTYEKLSDTCKSLSTKMWIILQQIQTMYVRLNLDLYQTVAPSVKCLHMR